MKRITDKGFNWLIVLGIRPGRDRELLRARAGLLGHFAERANVLILAQLLAALIALKAFWPTAPKWELAALGALLFAGLIYLGRMKKKIEAGLTRHSFSAAQWQLAGICFGLGLIWGTSAVLLTSPTNQPGQYVTYAILTGLMSVTALALSPVPLAAIALIAGLGMGGMALGWQLNSPDMTFIIFVFMIGMAIAAYASGYRMLLRLYGERRLAEQNEVVRLLLKQFEDSSGDVLWEVDAARRLERVTSRFAEYFDRDVDSLQGHGFLELLGGEGWSTGQVPEELRKLTDAMREHQSFRNLLLPVTVKGEERWCELSASPRQDDDGRFLGYRGVLSDVTSEQQSARKISHMARYDALTGLPNRLHMNEALQNTVIRCQKDTKVAAFMMIDLDRFKAVNDTLGHPVGDRLLEQVAVRLRNLMGPNDMAGRLGGDEFAVLMRDVTNVDRVEQLAEQIITNLSKPYKVGDHTLFIGASVGSAICPKDGHIADKLVRNADLALYKAKEEGRGVHRRYEPALYAKAEERRAMETALREALERGELSLEYQPIVDAIDTRIIGCEALLRWHHPTMGMIPPDQFIPIAEEARLITRIGEWVMRSACMEAANWPSYVHVAVNLSVEQFLDKHLYETIISALAHSGLDATRLELEVTESVFLNERTDVLETLERLISIGVRVSLDDFGTSYSSLGFLGRTKFSTIKIDRRYVRDAGMETRESQAVIKAVVAMAESLGIHITAEGAESDQELAMIRQLGCDQAQGYLFSKPMSAQEVRTLFREGRHHQRFVA